MISRLTRNSLGLLMWLVAVGIMIPLNLVVMVANYLACKTSFELLGFEMRPLATDELLGGFFGAFFSQATLAHFYALAVAITVGVSCFFVFHLGFRISELFEDRRAYLGINDQENAQAVDRLIKRDAVLIFIFSSLLLVALFWDFQLFKFRSIAGAGQIEDAAQATQLLDWPLQLKENGEMWAWRLTHIGAWGYVAITVLACLGLEFSFLRTREYAMRLWSALEELFHPTAEQESGQTFYGYDQDGQPVYDPNAPIAYDIGGNRVDQPAAALDANNGSENGMYANVRHDVEPTREFREGTANRNGTSESPLFGSIVSNHNGNGNHESQNDDAERKGTTRAAQSPGELALIEVIGSQNSDRVTLSSALADREHYWVDPDTHEVWDASFRRELMNDGVPKRPDTEERNNESLQ